MPIPPELQQAFIRLELIKQALGVTVQNLHDGLAVAQEAIDAIKRWHEESRPQ
jgi:hypothetical protein